MRNIKLVVAYDGTAYHGFQEQKGTGLPTVQEELEKKVTILAGKRVQVFGSGRTDAGVHAQGQVVNFEIHDGGIPTDRIPLALNGMLPFDIAALSAEDVPNDFHARFSAKMKEYRYTIYNSRIPNPLLHRYSYFFPKPLDFRAMQQAAAYLEGIHDFAAFKADGVPVKDTVRNLFEIKIGHRENLVDFIFRGEGFLHHMVRILTGTLLDVGIKRYPPMAIQEIINSRDRTRAGATVPPQGLFLMRVYY